MHFQSTAESSHTSQQNVRVHIYVSFSAFCLLCREDSESPSWHSDRSRSRSSISSIRSSINGSDSHGCDDEDGVGGDEGGGSGDKAGVGGDEDGGSGDEDGAGGDEDRGSGDEDGVGGDEGRGSGPPS